MVDKSFYNTVLCQTFSPCGKFLYTGDIYGEIAIFNIAKILNPSDVNQAPLHRKPKFKFDTKGIEVCSLITTENFLVSGCVGKICGWDWKTLNQCNKSPKLSWSLQIPTTQDIFSKIDVNSILYDEKSKLLYAGCGDNNIYVFNLEDGKLLKTMSGHSDYVHNLHYLNSQLVSASEDGTVKLWDLRDKTFVNQISPYNKDKLARPNLGKWIGAASLNEDWLLCGGGPRLSLWHLRSLDVATIFPLPDMGIHVAQFYEDRIMAGGLAPQFYQLGYNGDIYAEIPSSSTTIYSAISQESPKILCIAGSSPKIDICTNFSYRDQILTLY